MRITRQSRSLGYWHSADSAAEPRPIVVGGLASVERERRRAIALYSGGIHWREALFVGDRRIACSAVGYPTVRDILDELRDPTVRDIQAFIRTDEP